MDDMDRTEKATDDEILESFVKHKDSTAQEIIDLGIRNYIENKHEQGIVPTINHVSSLKICRDNSVRCNEVAYLVQKLGFSLEESEGKTLSELSIYK